MESKDEICSSEDEFDLAMFRSIDNILNENKENTDRVDSSDVVINTRRIKIIIIESESEDSSDPDVTEKGGYHRIYRITSEYDLEVVKNLQVPKLALHFFQLFYTNFCDTCSEKPRIHLGECFLKYHTKENYKA